MIKLKVSLMVFISIKGEILWLMLCGDYFKEMRFFSLKKFVLIEMFVILVIKYKVMEGEFIICRKC